MFRFKNQSTEYLNIQNFQLKKTYKILQKFIYFSENVVFFLKISDFRRKYIKIVEKSGGLFVFLSFKREKSKVKLPRNRHDI